MYYYLGGGDAPSHRTLINEVGAKKAAVSFVGLSRRIRKLDTWHLDEKFNDGIGLLLDSGAHSINREEGKYTVEELASLYEKYKSYVEDNIDRLDLFTEFDALPLGLPWIDQERTALAVTFGIEKFMPIWHESSGLPELHRLADTYQNLGITATSLSGRNLVPTLNQIAAKGVRLHGVGITGLEEIYGIRWHSVSSLSWVSPQRNGETIIWTGKQLKRYPKRQKDQARKRYRTYIENIGFDPEKIEADDTNELLKLSAWSWEQLMDDVDHKHGLHLTPVPQDDSTDDEDTPEDGDVVTYLPWSSAEDSAQGVEDTVATHTPEVPNRPATPVLREETNPLPIFGIKSRIEKVTGEDGETEEVEYKQLVSRSESTRPCASCFLAARCPAFEVNSTCAYNIPVTIRTKDDLRGVHNFMLEMQTQRVAFMRFAEEQEGGYADPNLSMEIDRLNKMVKTSHEMDQSSFSVKVEAKSSNGAAQAGMLERLFGSGASDKARALPQPLDTDQVIMDAEIIGETEL